MNPYTSSQRHRADRVTDRSEDGFQVSARQHRVQVHPGFDAHASIVDRSYAGHLCATIYGVQSADRIAGKAKPLRRGNHLGVRLARP